MKRPTKVRVGYQDYEILLVPKDYLDSASGLCQPQQGRILLEGGLGRRARAETLLHEILHAIVHSWGIEGILGDSEEQIVSLISLGMASVIRQNPALVVWFSKELD